MGLHLLLIGKPFGILPLLLIVFVLKAALPVVGGSKLGVLSSKHCPCCSMWILFNKNVWLSLVEGRWIKKKREHKMGKGCGSSCKRTVQME